MKMRSGTIYHFPYFSRIFSAQYLTITGYIILWVLLILLIATNIKITAQSRYDSKLASLSALRYPTNAGIHEQLAELYYSSGDIKRANQELSIYHDLQTVSQTLPASESDSIVLGEATQSVINTEDWSKADRQKQMQYAYWQTIVREKPFYRDAYIISAYLAAEMGKTDDAWLLIRKAEILDPNNTTILALERQLGKFGSE